MFGRWEEESSSKCLEKWKNGNTGEILKIGEYDPELYGLNKGGYTVKLFSSDQTRVPDEKWKFWKKSNARNHVKDLIRDYPNGLKDTGKILTLVGSSDKNNSVLDKL